MKRIRLLILLGMVAVALPLGLLQGVAKARSTSSTPTGSVSINQYADWDTVGVTLDVGLQVACNDPTGAGNVTVNVTQTPPGLTTPVLGAGTQRVVCDGRSRYVGVTVGPGPFYTGKAYATATLTTVTSAGPVATASRWISVRVV